MIGHLATTLLAIAAPLGAATDSLEPRIGIRIDSARREIVISVGPVDIPAATPYTHHGNEAYHAFRWPVSGWMRGYRVDLLDSAGRQLSRELLHHAGMANLDRRQIVYPIAERLFAAARETTPVRLPGSVGLPLAADQRMVLYYALVNPGPTAVTGARLEVRIAWTDAGERGLTSILPFYANAKAPDGRTISFDIPPGRSTMSSEITIPVDGWLRALGGHLHDHGVELRLEDAETGKVLARLRAKRTRGGRLLEVGRTNFALKRRGLRLHADRRYRIVAVYDNPTGRTITGGAMGFVAGAFVPRNAQRLSADVADPTFQRDVAGLLGERARDHASEHGSHR